MKRPTIAFLGAGRVGRTLAQAFTAAGWTVAAVAGRDALQATVDAADLVFLTVPDDEIAKVAAAVRWRAGQAVVHCSGATEVAVLAPAAEVGAQTGGFHPLQLFADPELALRHMAGCSVGIEAPPVLEAVLRQLAEAVGYRPITLPPGARGLYHAGCCHSAGFLLSLLREACDLWNSFGVGDQEALAALLPLARGTLAAASEKGLAGALAGPFSRGDSGVVARHLQELSALGEAHVALYRAVAAHQLRLARERGRLDEDALARLATAVPLPTYFSHN